MNIPQIVMLDPLAPLAEALKQSHGFVVTLWLSDGAVLAGTAVVVLQGALHLEGHDKQRMWINSNHIVRYTIEE